MPEEKTIIGVPEDVAEKLKKESSEEVRDILDVPGRRSEIWVEGRTEEASEKKAERYVSSYERKLKELQSAPAPAASTASDDAAVKFDADSIRHMEDAAGRVQKLLDLALVKGVAHAVSVAEHIDAYTLDRTHDRMVDELSDELRKQGMLKESE